MDQIKNEIKERPILYIFIAIIGTAITVIGSSTFATISYVDKQDFINREYHSKRIDSLSEDVRRELEEIKELTKDNNRLIINLIRNRK